MKHLKMFGLALAAVMALTGLTASIASATTLEVEGAAQNQSVTVTVSQKSGTSMLMARTDGSFANTCTSSHAHGEGVIPYSDPEKIVIALTPGEGGLSFSNCTRPVQVHKSGSISIESIGGTNGTVSSSEAEVTIGSIFGTLNCKTGAGTHLGTLTGAATGHATIHISAVINCGFLVPSATWKTDWVITSPTGLGVVA